MARVLEAPSPPEEPFPPGSPARRLVGPTALPPTEVARLQALRLVVWVESRECLKPVNVSEAQPREPGYRRPQQGPTA